MEKNKCVFFVTNNKCSILTLKRCMRCHFCKTAEELSEGRSKADERFHSLSPSRQEELTARYREELI